MNLPFVSFLSIVATTLFCCFTMGCADETPPPRTAYVRAHAVSDVPTPPLAVRATAPGASVAASPAPTIQPGQYKHVPLPHAATGASTPSSPEQVVADANRQASQGPSGSAYFNAIVRYGFEPGSLYQVYAAPMRVTDIALEPGEKVLGQPAAGDVVRWVLAIGKSVAGGLEQEHVYLKPTRDGLETNLCINTDRRSYMLELHSYPDTYMAAVQWDYPQDMAARVEAQATEAAALRANSSPVVGLDTLNFNYAVHVDKGEPSWAPVQVFDDGRRTFIRFPQAMLVREAPALFVLRNKETQLVNYRVKSDFYVVDRLFDSAELRVGQQDQEIVRIVREKGGK